MPTYAQQDVSVGCFPFLGGAIAEGMFSYLLPSRVKLDFETSSASVNNSLIYLLQHMASFTVPKPVVPQPAILLTLLLTVAQEAFPYKRFPSKTTFLNFLGYFLKEALVSLKLKRKRYWSVYLCLVTYWQCKLIQWPQERLEVKK